MVIRVGDSGLDQIIVRFDADQASEVLLAASRLWEELVPDRPFEFYFVDEAFRADFTRDASMGDLLSLLAGFCTIIAAMGLFGLTGIVVAHRRRELAVRKSLGADPAGICRMLSQDILKLVTTAVAISVPVVLLFTSYWLSAYSYRVSVSPTEFLVVGFYGALIALGTISWHVFRAATEPPVSALRDQI